jgi:hypothetical protein
MCGIEFEMPMRNRFRNIEQFLAFLTMYSFSQPPLTSVLTNIKQHVILKWL